MIKNFIFTKLLIVLFFFISSCAQYEINKSKKPNKPEKKYYSSHGFALIYEDKFYKQKVTNKKIKNTTISSMHSSLKSNTHVKIINPRNSKFVETKITKKSFYPKIFNIVISKKIAEMLELNPENPYVEVLEVKKNKTFVAKESNTFDEERNVSTKVPVEKIKMDDITESNISEKKETQISYNFILVVSDFYYLNSAQDLKKDLEKQIKIQNFRIRKISNNKYRLLAGPFKNFNALKSTYISLNNLGFESLNIYEE